MGRITYAKVEVTPDDWWMLGVFDKENQRFIRTAVEVDVNWGWAVVVREKGGRLEPCPTCHQKVEHRIWGQFELVRTGTPEHRARLDEAREALGRRIADFEARMGLTKEKR